MHRRLLRLHAFVFSGRGLWTEELIALLLVVLIFVSPTSAVIRFTNRSLLMTSTVPNATTSYTISFQYTSPVAIGSVDLLFCEDPIPYMPCVTPPGLDVSNAYLSSQTGETGFSIDPGTHTNNHIILTRNPAEVPNPSTMSSYKLDGIVNPANTEKSFSIRMRSHESLDASGPQIDVGSITGQVTNSVHLETQVPPMLIFCLAQQVEENCTGTDNTFFKDMGELTSTNTVTAQSQMAVGTNASAGFAITANGDPPSAGTASINEMDTPAASKPGTNQFGINLVANTSPVVGEDPQGPFANGVPAVDYGTPDVYKYQSGDLVAYSPNVSLMRKFTVSYILNASSSLKPGVYSTTITFVASGRF